MHVNSLINAGKELLEIWKEIKRRDWKDMYNHNYNQSWTIKRAATLAFTDTPRLTIRLSVATVKLNKSDK